MTAKKKTGTGGGRPTKYRPRMAKTTRRLASKGLTNVEIAKVLGVAESTFQEWLRKHSELAEALREAKIPSNAIVEASLFRRATGFAVPETRTIFDSESGQVIEYEVLRYYPPDVRAAQYWLKNRDPDRWRETAALGDKPLEITLNYRPRSERERDSDQ